VAKLQHPNIVQIFHIDEHGGCPFFEMEYVGGGSLADQLVGIPCSPRSAARLVETLAHAMAEAHRLGIVHRDLKPANILLTTDGTPKVTDFGLAKSIGSESNLTQSGAIMGSPSYMAPEQAEGKTKQVGPAADVYALGAILYEQLTGRPPFRGETLLDTIQQVKTAEPVPPSRLVAGLPRDVETIALKCLSKDPARRYDSAIALAEDLRRFRVGKPIVARPVGSMERTWRWCRRNPAIAGALAAAAAALVAVAGFALLYADQQTRFGHQQAQARRQADLSLAVSEFERGHALCEQGEIGPGLLRMISSWRSAVSAGDPDWPNAVRAGLASWQREYNGPEAVLSFAGLFDAALSPDKNTILTGGRDKTARLWNVSTSEPIGLPMLHDGVVRAVAFSPDGKTIATGSHDGTVRIWDATTGTSIGKPLQHGRRVWTIAFSPDGKTLLSGSVDETAQLWRTATGTPIGPTLRHGWMIMAVAFSPDSKTALTGGTDGTARFWDVATGKPVRTPISHRPRVEGVAFSPDGQTVLTAGDDGLVKMWDAATSQPIGSALSHRAAVDSVAFSPDGQTILTGCQDGMARLWDAASQTPIGEPFQNQGPVLAAMFSRDGTNILTGSTDDTVRLWHASTAQATGTPLMSQDKVWGVAFSPDGKTALTGSGDNTARFWDTATGKPAGAPISHPEGVTGVAFSPDGKTVLTGSYDGMARLWEASTGRQIGSPLRHQGWVHSVAFSPDGKTLLTGSSDRTAMLWDAATGKPVGSPMHHEDEIWSVAFSPDGKSVVTGSWDATARVWDAATGKPLGSPIEPSGGMVWSVAFSPDGKTILTGSGDGKARVWNAATGEPVGDPMRHSTSVTAVAFSPDGKTVVTGSYDQTVRLWDVATRRPIGRPMPHHGLVRAVAFSPDGKTILTGSEDHLARLWPVANVPDDLERVAIWIEAITALTLDSSGQIKPLDRTAWLERHQRLEQLGGAPATIKLDRLDPVLFGPDPTARAKAWIKLGRWKMAEVAFSAALDARPLDTAIRLERAQFYSDRSQPERANQDIVCVLEQTPGSRGWGSPLNGFLMGWAKSPQSFARLMELRPGDARLWTARARRHALRDEWQQAAADFSRAIDSAPPESEEWFEFAALRLIVGDHSGYETFLRQARARVGDAPDPFVAFVLARICTLTAEPVVDPALVIRWAESAVARDRGAASFCALGMAHYRAGHFDEAVRWLTEPGVEAWGGLGTMQIQLGLAMAHHRRGDPAKARRLLDEVEQSWTSINEARTDGAANVYVIDWLAVHPLRREARALILGDPKDKQPGAPPTTSLTR